jgi:hypothetical protein
MKESFLFFLELSAKIPEADEARDVLGLFNL